METDVMKNGRCNEFPRLPGRHKFAETRTVNPAKYARFNGNSQLYKSLTHKNSKRCSAGDGTG